MIATAGNASALVKYGPAPKEEVTISNGDVLMDKAECNVNGYWTTDDDGRTRIHFEGRCSTGFDVSSANLKLSATAGSCIVSYVPGDMDGRATFAGDSSYCGPGEGGTVLSLCYDLDTEYHVLPFGVGDREVKGCADWPLGPPPGPPTGGVCSIGGVTAPNATFTYIGNSFDRLDTSFIVSTTVPTTYKVLVWYTYNQGGNAGKLLQATPASTGTIGPGQNLTITPGTVNVGHTGTSGPPLGIGMSVTLLDFPGSKWVTGGTDATMRANGQYSWVVPTGPDADIHKGGMTDPPRCTWYYGGKIAEDPFTEQDVPAGPVGAPPEVNDPPVLNPTDPDDGVPCVHDFDWENPETWVSMGQCALIAAVIALPVAITTAMIASLVPALQGVLEWMFKPTTDTKASLTRIKTDLLTKQPFAWINGFGGLPSAVPIQGCPDWVVKVQVPARGHVDATNTSENVVCDSSYTAKLRGARPVLAFFMLLLALWPLLRSTAYAAFPIIKPQPGVLR